MLPLPHLVAAGDDGHGVRAPPLLARVRHAGSTKGAQTAQQAPNVEGGNSRSLARVTACWRRRCGPWFRGEHLMQFAEQRGRWSGAGGAKLQSVKGKLGSCLCKAAAAQLMWKSLTLRVRIGAAGANTWVVLETRQEGSPCLPVSSAWMAIGAASVPPPRLLPFVWQSPYSESSCVLQPVPLQPLPLRRPTDCKMAYLAGAKEDSI